MSVVSYLFEQGVQYAGHALSLGHRYVFYSQNPDLSDLDGQMFNELSEVRDAISGSTVAAKILSKTHP